MPVICPVAGTGVYLLAMTAEITEEPVRPVQESPPVEEEAPYGWMTDPVTGDRRPKKRPGRRSKTAKVPVGPSPAIEQLQALGSLPDDAEDTAPGAPPKGRKKPAMRTEALPPFRAGVIAKGMNKLYRKAGRIVRIWDYELGGAIIASATRAADDDDDDDTTVGEAWEAVAKSNPRIRAFLLKLMVGGAWSALFTAHLPIFMAIAMKESVRSRIPFLQLAETLLTDEPEGGAGGGAVPSGLAQMMGGINPDDMAQMMAMAQGLMGQMAADVPRAPNVPREPVNGFPGAQEAPREHAVGPE